jgi:hypothetical protein
MTPTEKRHALAHATLTRLLEQRDNIVAKLVRLELKVRATRKLVDRQQRAMVKTMTPATVPVSVAQAELLPEPKPEPKAVLNDPVPDLATGQPPKADGLEIPAWMRRTKEGDAAAKAASDAADAAACAALVAEQAQRKRLKSLARIGKMKAKASGATKQMPLTGKAAAAFIRNG